MKPRHCIVKGPEGLALVAVDPPLLEGDILIDLSGLTEGRVPVSRTVTPTIDESALADLIERMGEP